MKVLLVGEYSSLHNNLQSGLQQLGVDVDTANFGDGFKKFKSDLKLYRINSKRKYNMLRKYYSAHLYKKMMKYDVVQFVNENELGITEGLSPKLGAKLAKDVRLSVLLLAGCNYQYFMYGQDKVNISPCEDCMKYDLKSEHGCVYRYNNQIRKASYAMQRNVDVIVPMAYEYYMCNRDSEFSHKLSKPIPMPILINNDNLPSRNRNGKLIVFHPLNREGFKGTKTIQKAFDILRRKYSDIAEFIIDGKMAYDQYIKLMEKVDIVVDQKNCLTFGIASLNAMKEGKILITGNYRSRIDDPYYNYIHNAPAFVLGNTVEEMVTNIGEVIERRAEFPLFRKKGIEFVETYHEARMIAGKFLKLYEDGLAKYS